MSPVQILKFINGREYIPHFSWVSPTNAQGIPIEKARSLWTSYVSPRDVDRENIYNASSGFLYFICPAVIFVAILTVSTADYPFFVYQAIDECQLPPKLVRVIPNRAGQVL